MFRRSRVIETLDLSSFTLRTGVNTTNMFDDTSTEVADYATGYAKDDATIAQFNESTTGINTNKLRFMVKQEPTRSGDVNGDGSVDSSDLSALVSFIMGDVTPGASADINGDGSIDSSDLSALVQIIIGI